MSAALWMAMGACTQEGAETATSRKPPLVRLPSQILGLTVGGEDVSKKVADVKRSYVDSLGVFGMREGDLLRATLQVARLNRAARPGDRNFQASIIELLGASTPVQIKVGDITVYSTSGNRQTIFIWFRGRGMFVLNVHQDFEFPRTLLRRLTNLELA